MRNIKILKNAINQIIIQKYDDLTLTYNNISLMINNAHLKFINDEFGNHIGIFAIDTSSTYFYFHTDDFKAYEIEPDPEVAFSGTSQELMDIFIDEIFTTTGDSADGLGGAGGGSDATAANQQTQITKLQTISDDAVVLKTYSSYNNWSYIVGNSKEIVYYPTSTPGTDVDNPSGSGNNIKQVILKMGVSTVITQTFSYDTSNRIIKIIAT